MVNRHFYRNKLTETMVRSTNFNSSRKIGCFSAFWHWTSRRTEKISRLNDWSCPGNL